MAVPKTKITKQQLETATVPVRPKVLTLAETAAYLRVPEEAVLELVKKEALPAQEIGGEWRFLKRTVVEWLRFGPLFHRKLRELPPWVLEHPFWESLIQALVERIVSESRAGERPSAGRGSKESVLKHFGVFQGDDDLEERLAAVRAQREAAGE